MNYQLVKPDQFKEVLELLKKSAQRLKDNNIQQWDYWLNPPQEKIDWIQEGIANKEFFFFYQSEELFGMYRLLYEDILYWGHQEKKAGYIHSLVVKPVFSGKGIGSQVMQHIEHELIQQDIHLLRLDCVANNKRLCKYYEQLGFMKVGEVQMPLSFNNLYEKQL
ncbi:GNAT family N-acetyltransferase [Urechidicola sp. KH5]